MDAAHQKMLAEGGWELVPESELIPVYDKVTEDLEKVRWGGGYQSRPQLPAQGTPWAL